MMKGQSKGSLHKNSRKMVKAKGVPETKEKAGCERSSKKGEIREVFGKEFWFQAPFFGGMDKFWQIAREFRDVGKGPPNPLLGVPKARVGDELDPTDVYRFGVERGKYPFFNVAWKSHVQSPRAYKLWVQEILTNPTFAGILESAQVSLAICTSLRANITRGRNWLEVMLSRWWPTTHTFIAAWGEITPTLEDVCYLWNLNLMGEVNPALPLTPEQEKNCGDSVEGEECGYDLEDGIQKWRGGIFRPCSFKSVPLAPLFLGTLYKRLDLIAPTVRLFKRTVTIYALMLTQVFWGCSSMNNLLPVLLFLNEFITGQNECRASRWVNAATDDGGTHILRVRGGLESVIDDESGFLPQLYVEDVEGIAPFGIYSKETMKVSMGAVKADRKSPIVLNILVLGGLPCYVGGIFGKVMYNPMRVARQFGLDQGAPPILPSTEGTDVWRRYLTKEWSKDPEVARAVVVFPGGQRVSSNSSASMQGLRKGGQMGRIFGDVGEGLEIPLDDLGDMGLLSCGSGEGETCSRLISSTASSIGVRGAGGLVSSALGGVMGALATPCRSTSEVVTDSAMEEKDGEHIVVRHDDGSVELKKGSESLSIARVDDLALLHKKLTSLKDNGLEVKWMFDRNDHLLAQLEAPRWCDKVEQLRASLGTAMGTVTHLEENLEKANAAIAHLQENLGKAKTVVAGLKEEEAYCVERHKAASELATLDFDLGGSVGQGLSG
ncbi:hypothetical protein Vadar_005728 [Vaccinium darrowii]|uniref:Uncharacterized protein n=1 Tax=Vaccinium darrowii TaxID=229202 RepID=A0ACB7Y560_9ERIC|nr:hypothetical protein Vadar_005728 [Vaccinium darrowii]